MSVNRKIVRNRDENGMEKYEGGNALFHRYAFKRERKASKKKHIDKSLAVVSKVMVQNKKKNYLKDEGKIYAAYNHSMTPLAYVELAHCV